MDMIRIVIAGFILLESANVLALYFNPGTQNFNAVGVFTAWEKSKTDPEIHDFVRYLVNWVAGTKMIFLMLLWVILFTADGQSMLLYGVALVASISSFFWRLFPLLQTMDRESHIRPKGYSNILGVMITAFITLFLAAVIAGYLI